MIPSPVPRYVKICGAFLLIAAFGYLVELLGRYIGSRMGGFAGFGLIVPLVIMFIGRKVTLVSLVAALGSFTFVTIEFVLRSVFQKSSKIITTVATIVAGLAILCALTPEYRAYLKSKKADDELSKQLLDTPASLMPKEIETMPAEWHVVKEKLDWPAAEKTCQSLGNGWELPSDADVLALLSVMRSEFEVQPKNAYPTNIHESVKTNVAGTVVGFEWEKRASQSRFKENVMCTRGRKPYELASGALWIQLPLLATFRDAISACEKNSKKGRLATKDEWTNYILPSLSKNLGGYAWTGTVADHSNPKPAQALFAYVADLYERKLQDYNYRTNQYRFLVFCWR